MDRLKRSVDKLVAHLTTVRAATVAPYTIQKWAHELVALIEAFLGAVPAGTFGVVQPGAMTSC